jgi:hypothetical protein
MRRALLACLLAGCYHASNLACAVSCASDQSCPSGLQCGLSDHLCHAGPRECSEIDPGGPEDAGPLPIIDAPAPDASIAPFCDRSKATILACYEFENNTTNGSQYMLTTTPTGATFKESMMGLGQALSLARDSNVQIAETVSLDLQSFTVEAWLNPSFFSGQNLSVVNNGGQYGIFVDPSNAAFCAKVTPAQPPNPPVLVTTHAPAVMALRTGQWTHVACVYDGTNLTVYVDGANANEDTTGGAVVTTAMGGTGIGSQTPTQAQENHYVGLIDNLRIWSVPRTGAQICADAAPNCR